MAARGRGVFFSMLNSMGSSQSGTGSNDDNLTSKDSGLASTDTSTSTKRLGRGSILSGLSDLSLGMSKSDSGPSSLKSGSTNDANRGRGRAMLFMAAAASSKSMQSDEAISVGDTIKSHETPPAEIARSVQSTDDSKEIEFFKPSNVTGTSGQIKNMACNYLRLRCDSNKGVYMYDVKFSPPVDSTNIRVRLLNKHREVLGVKTYDGQHLCLPIRLKERVLKLVSHDDERDVDVKIEVIFKREESYRQCMHLYNVLFDRVLKQLKFVRFGRKQFDPTEAKFLPHAKLEIWPGYVTAVDVYDGGLMLCCDISHRVLFQKTVLEMLREIYQMSSVNFKENAKKSLLGSVVITRYNDRTYRIDDIRFDQSPMSTFQTKNGEMTYYDYYKKSHGIEIADKSQPMLLSIKKMQKYSENKSEDVIFCLVPEVCFLTGLRDDMRSDFKLMRDLASFTKVTPNQRILALRKFYNNVMDNPEACKILSDWGLSLDNGIVEVSGRVLEEEQIQMAQRKFGVGAQADFGKHVVNNELLEVVHLHTWIVLHCKNDTRIANSFWDLYDRSSRALGIECRKPKFVLVSADRSDVFVNALRANIDSKTQLVVCICPTSRDDRYAAIKRICCSEIPIPSQVINARTLSNEAKSRSIVQKIALQINCKLGGTLWSIKIPFKGVMICGVDAYHDAGQKGKSVAGFVASTNSNYTKWYSRAIMQEKREEIVKGLCASMIASLQAYERHNGCLPEKVILFRDGVGDGQFPYCQEFEIPQLEAALNGAYSSQSIKLTFIVVQKRINARFYEARPNRDAENPPPGSVIDSTITRANLYDFFLVSQCTRQGTVTPTHFVVLRDDAGFKPDILQRLSYKLCFLYYNWPGSIRSPACCQYAHKLAGLVGQNIGRLPAEELATKLYFL